MRSARRSKRTYDAPDFATAIAWTVPRDALHAGVETLAPALATIPVATIDIDEPCRP